MSFNNLVDLYKLEKSNITFSHVENNRLTLLAESIEQYRKEVQGRYDNDQHLNEVLNLLRRVFFKLIGSFLPYNKVISNEMQNELLKKFYQIKNSYPELFSSTVIGIAKVFKEITETKENSMNDYLQNRLNNKSNSIQMIAIVTRRALPLDEKQQVIGKLKINYEINFFTENSFRKEINIFDEVIYIGSPNYFGEYTRNTFNGSLITFLSYDMFASSIKLKGEFEDIDRKGAYSTLFNQVTIGEAIQKKVSIKLEEKESLNIAVKNFLDDQKRIGVNSSDTIEANIVYLENDRFLFASQDSKIRVILPEKKNNFIKQKEFNNVEEDDYIVIRNESDTKLITEVADQILKSQAKDYRLTQKEWKTRLLYNIEKKGINKVSQILSKKYNLKTASTGSIRNWCDENSINPTELPKLLMALKYTEKEAEKIYKKMREIKRAHLKAGRLISDKLMNELSAEIFLELREQGYYTFTSKEFDGASFNIERIVSIDRSEYLIAPYNLMRPIEID